MTPIKSPKKLIEVALLHNGGHCEGPFYVRKPFTQEPDWAVTSINLDLGELLKKADPIEGRSQ